MRAKLGVRIFSIWLLLLLSCQSLFAQLTTIGREFYVGFMENNRTETRVDVAKVIVTANEDVTGFIRTPTRTINFELAQGEQFVQAFSSDTENIIHRTSGEIEFKSLYINTTGDVTVHAFNERARSADGTVVLPVTALGKEYYAMAHFDVFGPDQEPGSNTNFESTLLIVATEDDTDLEIVTTFRTVNTIPAGAPLNITLDAGETYQIKANGDLTGTRVRVLNGAEGDCKNVAVFAGNKMTSAGDCGTTGDHMFQQAYPTFAWGKEFVHIPLAGRTSGEIVKVLASKDNTEVRVNGQVIGRLDEGEFLKQEFARDEVAVIETDKPSSVAVIAKSQGCNVQSGSLASFGDPSLTVYSPNNQRITDVLFSSVQVVGIVVHYANVLVPAGAANQTLLNGQNVGGEFRPVPGNPDYEYARLVVREGANRLSNPEGFIAYAYGSGFIESYSYSVGTALERIQYETETRYDFDVEGDKVACLNQEGIWTIIPENEDYTLFTWDFGDGTELQDGRDVSHTFTEKGIYQVKVLASTGEDRCDREEEFTFEVEVLEVLAELNGPASVCPQIDEITYELVDRSNFGSAIWEIEGGEILAETDSTLTVRWGEASTSAFVSAIPLTEAGCYGEELRLDVVIADTLDPDAPLGPSAVCGGESLGLVYSVPFPSADRAYSWEIVGGTIVSGQDTESITVDWDLSSPVRQLFYNESGLTNAACLGVSESISFEVLPPLSISSSFDNASCPGDRNGFIEILVTGGSEEYDFTWSHDAGLETNLAQGLDAGVYEVMVSDASGCAVEVLTFELQDPAPIEILSTPEIITATCNTLSDGQVIVEMSGGTGQLQVFDFPSVWDGRFLTVSEIPVGDFSLFIQDESGCGVPLAGTMTAPEPMSLSFEVGSPSCPEAVDGELTVLVEGGTAPYTYLWDDGSQGATASGLSSGLVQVTVIDANGCEVSGTGEVPLGTPQVRLPTGFIPKDGPYGPIVTCGVAYQLMIWNRWGQLMYSGSEGWDGLFEGNEAGIGVYSYTLDYTYQTSGEIFNETKRGTFTLVR
ncbi:PKD domain-containing protein [Algoriphagus namhaensis]